MSNINCLYRLAACVKEKALGDDQSLKLRGMFVQLLFVVHTNQLDMPNKKHVTNNSAQNTADTSENLKVIGTNCWH
jgi:hypothetical protein